LCPESHPTTCVVEIVNFEGVRYTVSELTNKIYGQGEESLPAVWHAHHIRSCQYEVIDMLATRYNCGGRHSGSDVHHVHLPDFLLIDPGKYFAAEVAM
jgi:hypothetical protein